MNDEDLLQQAANCPTMYFDGFGNYRMINGVLRCIGFIIGSGAQLNLVVSRAGADVASAETRRVLDGAPTQGLNIWKGTARAH